jgi:hypothetical protein
MEKRTEPEQLVFDFWDRPVDSLSRTGASTLERPRDGMTGLATGLKTTRPQEILTPESVVKFCHLLWGEGVRLDPCASNLPESVVKAEIRYVERDDGLQQVWLDRTYVNPPYKNLKQWMQLASQEARQGYRIAMLCPVRGHRDWWHEYRDTASVEVQLKPLKFVGYDQAFPAPLCLLLWNTTEGVEAALAAAGLKYTKVTYL